MGENMFFYDHSTERLLRDSRDMPSTSSSDSDDFGLIIDLEMNHCKTTASNHSNKECNNDEFDDDTLSIGCEENETSVNFFIKVEKPGKKPNLNKKLAIPKGSTRMSNAYYKKGFINPTEKQPQPLINKCNKCEVQVATINELYIHFTNRHQEEIFKCSECPYENRLHKSVYEHMKSHYIKCATFKCKCCSFVTSEKDSFKEHKSLHVKMKMKKEAKFQCPVCSYSRSFVSTLNHFKTHAKEHKDLKNILICPVCDMKVKNFGKHARHHIKLKFGDTDWWEEDKYESKKKSKDGDDTLEKMSNGGDETLEKKSNEGDETLEKKSNEGDETLEKKSSDDDMTLEKKNSNGHKTYGKKNKNGDKTLEKKDGDELKIDLNYIDDDAEMTSKQSVDDYGALEIDLNYIDGSGDDDIEMISK